MTARTLESEMLAPAGARAPVCYYRSREHKFASVQARAGPRSNPAYRSERIFLAERVAENAREKSREHAIHALERAPPLKHSDQHEHAGIAIREYRLGLFPRYAKALLRKAVCLLEAGRPAESVEAFEALLRVDRKWRAHRTTHQRPLRRSDLCTCRSEARV